MSARRRGSGGGPESFGPGPVSVRTRFERFPASVKGAFVFRGEDADPHQVGLLEAQVSRFPDGRARSIAVEPAVLHVAPHRDVFVPFELGVSDLEPGWYDLGVVVDLDGSRRVLVGDRRFAVGWPRGAVHRGRTPVAAAVTLAGGITVEVERLDCEATSATVHLRVSPPEADWDLRIDSAAGEVPVLETQVDVSSGRAKAVAYPVMAGQSSVTLEFRPDHHGAPARGAAATVEVRLR